VFTPTDGWITCALGHRHWGRAGAAGLLLHRDGMRGPEVLLQHRAEWSHHGGTWGTPGGALHADEDPATGALREVHEELGLSPEDVVLGATSVDDHGGWSYTTVIARTDDPRLPDALTAETLEVRWVPVAEMSRLPLHPGFVASWERVRAAAQASSAAASTVSGKGSVNVSCCPSSARPTST